MVVVVLPEVDEALRESQSLMIEVRSDDDLLPSAMTRLRQAMVRWEGHGDKGEVEGPAFVSQPVPLPGVQLLMVDFGSLPDESILAVPQLLERQLRDSGIRDAVVAVARPGRLEVLEGFGVAARAHLRGPPGGLLSCEASPPPPPPLLPLLDIAVEWLEAQRRPGDELSGFVMGVETPLTPASCRPVAAAILSTPPPAAGVTLVVSDFVSHLAAASVVGDYRNALPLASFTAAGLTAAGQRWTAVELAERMHQLRELIRKHVGAVVWAGVEAEAGTRRVLSARYEQPAFADGAPVPRRGEVDQLADILVPDAMWYQVLSTGHLERLGGLPAGAVPLVKGRAELTVGEPEQWVPGHRDGDVVRARGRELLAGCLVSEQEAFEMTVARVRQGRRPT